MPRWPDKKELTIEELEAAVLEKLRNLRSRRTLTPQSLQRSLSTGQEVVVIAARLRQALANLVARGVIVQVGRSAYELPKAEAPKAVQAKKRKSK